MQDFVVAYVADDIQFIHSFFPVAWDFLKGLGFDGVGISQVYKSCSQAFAFGRLLREFVFKDDRGNPIDEQTLLPDELSILNERLKEMVDQYIYYNGEHIARVSYICNIATENLYKLILSEFLVTHRENNRMLAKGHLAPRADFFYLVEERSTYFFANALPMWSSINEGNWLNMENWVRDLAVEKNCLLEAWTGGLQTLRIRDKDVYIGQRRGTPAVPVPLILYKIVRCEARNEAIVFVAINNPDLTPMETEDHIYCQQEYDFCRTTRPQWSNDIRRGFMYCCEYHDFASHQFFQQIGIPIERMRPDVQPLVG